MTRNPTTILSAIRAAIAAAALLAASIGASAQSAAPAGEVMLASSPGTVGCRPRDQGAALLCEASRAASVRTAGQTFAAVHVTPSEREGEAPALMMRFQPSHGMSVPAGVRGSVDEIPAASPQVRTSGPAVLFARTEPTAPLPAAMAEGAVMTVGVSSLGGRAFCAPLSREGFAAAHQKMIAP